MRNQKLIINLTYIFLLFVLTNSIAQAQTFDNVDITAANNNGIRFWNGNNNYRIAMGTGYQYQYGPVTNAAIKTSMTKTSGRGWVWGTYATTPVTALSVFGEFQTEGFIKSMDGNFFFGNNQRLSGDGDASLAFYSNNSDKSDFSLFDKEGRKYGTLLGDEDGASFGLLDGDDNWSYCAVKDSYTAFSINNDEKMRITVNGNVGIGAGDPQNKLEVCGTIRAEEVIVEEGWCDFVFEPEYCLTTIEEEAEFIELYGHLSNFESAKDMNGEINVNDIFKRQQIQIEENVLHLIELNDENEALQTQVNTLTANYKLLAEELAAIKKQLH